MPDDLFGGFFNHNGGWFFNRNIHYERYQRDPATKKRYGRQWQRIRDQYIATHPLCEKCQARGRVTPAEDVHHIVPLVRGGTHDPSNLMALCKPCHSRVTAIEGGRWQRR